MGVHGNPLKGLCRGIWESYVGSLGTPLKGLCRGIWELMENHMEKTNGKWHGNWEHVGVYRVYISYCRYQAYQETISHQGWT